MLAEGKKNLRVKKTLPIEKRGFSSGRAREKVTLVKALRWATGENRCVNLRLQGKDLKVNLLNAADVPKGGITEKTENILNKKRVVYRKKGTYLRKKKPSVMSACTQK